MLNLIIAPMDCDEKVAEYCKLAVAELKRAKTEYSVYFSPTHADVEANAEKLSSEGETEFVVVGDDATLGSFISNIKNLSKCKIGIIPVGEANFATHLGLNKKPANAIKQMLAGDVFAVDYLTLNNKKVINNILIGASAETHELYQKHKFKNIFTRTYVRSRYGSKYPGVNLKIDETIEDKTSHKEDLIYELCIANASKNAGKSISPLSNVNDGLLNLSYLTMQDKQTKSKSIKEFESGNHIYNENANQKWLTSVRISPEGGKVKALVDGRIEMFEELNVKVVESGLKIFNSKEQ